MSLSVRLILTSCVGIVAFCFAVFGPQDDRLPFAITSEAAVLNDQAPTFASFSKSPDATTHMDPAYDWALFSESLENAPSPHRDSVVIQHVVDFDGDGTTDFSVVRNTGGGAGGQITWFNLLSGGGNTGSQWGVSGDFFVPVDYDGDHKTDIAIWRSGTPGVAAFYILQSLTGTVRVETFGQTGDDPSMVGDYDGDGKADPAVYRGGANSGDPSTWYYRGSLNNPNHNITYIPWGQNGDFPAPGDFDGDGKADTMVQRNGGGGQARFWIRLATGSVSSVIFGTPTDVIVPGDYDGDGKTDIAVSRGSGGSLQWFYKPSGGGPDVLYQVWGASATDFQAPGDYDGDGKTDLAVWRPSATGGATAFFVRKSSNGAFLGVPWGANGDFPVAAYNKH